MRLQITYDKAGNIAAAMEIAEEAQQASHALAPGDGQSATIVYVPEEYRYLELFDLCQQLRVDVRSKRPRLLLRDEKGSIAAYGRGVRSYRPSSDERGE